MTELATEWVNTDAIQPHPKNARQGDVGAIIESLESHGQYRPLVVQRSTGFVLAGNHTYRALMQMGAEQVAVTFLDVDDDEALRIMLVDNRSAELAVYDDSALVELLRGLTETPLDLTGTGFSRDDLDDLVYSLEGPVMSASDDPIGDVQRYLDTVRIVLDLPTALAERFRECPGENDLERIKGLLGVG